MRSSDVSPNVETWAVYTRLLVQRGEWLEAYKLAVSAYRDWTQAPVFLQRPGLPLKIWDELLVDLRPNQIRRAEGMGITLARANPHIQLRIAMDLLEASGHNVPLSVAVKTIQICHRMGKHDLARQVVQNSIFFYNGKSAIRVLNVDLALRPRSGRRSAFAALRDLTDLATKHTDLRPDATTLFALLGHLKSARNAGSLAFNLVRIFVSRWGHRVLGPDVRTRLITLCRRSPSLVQSLSPLVRVLHKANWLWAFRRMLLPAIPRRTQARLPTYPRRGTRNRISKLRLKTTPKNYRARVASRARMNSLSQKFPVPEQCQSLGHEQEM